MYGGVYVLCGHCAMCIGWCKQCNTHECWMWTQCCMVDTVSVHAEWWLENAKSLFLICAENA